MRPPSGKTWSCGPPGRGCGRPEFPDAWGSPEDSAFPRAELKPDPIRLYADWIASCVQDAKARYPIAGKAVVVGHSQGAAFAQYISVRHPDLVKAYDGKAVRSKGDYRQAVSAAESSDKPEVKILLERTGKKREAEVKPGRLGFWLTER